MFKKLFKPLSIGSATALISLASFFSYAIGLVRDRIIAVNFGTTSETDIYNASFLIPDMLFNLFIAGALAAAFLPVFSSYLTKDKKEAMQIANTMLTGASILISTLALIAFIFMDKIIPAIFSNIDQQMQTDIINMTRLMLPSAILFAVSNTLGNILMAYKHFIAYSLSPIFYNLGIILGVIFLSEKYGIYSAGIGVLIGAFLHCAIRVIDVIYTKYRYKPQLQVKRPGFKKIIRLMIPKSISLIAWQLNLYIFAFVGIKIIEGGLAAFNFARNIQSFAVSLFGISFATAVFPYLTSASSEGDHSSYTEHIQKTIQRILFFTIPAMVGIMILSRPMVELILSGGVFDERATNLTSMILFFFAISIPFESLSHILARAFYAMQNTITPMLINISSMFIIALITLYAAPKFGIEWFSIAFSIGFIFYCILAIIILRKKLKNFKTRQFFESFAKTLFSTIVMALSVYFSFPLQDYLSPQIAAISQILIGALAFFASAYIIKAPEISSIAYVISRLKKKNTYE